MIFVTLYFCRCYVLAITMNIIWEENPSIGPKLNYARNGIYDDDDTIKNIKRELENTNLIDTIEINRLRKKLYRRRKAVKNQNHNLSPERLIKKRNKRREKNKRLRTNRYFYHRASIVNQKIKTGHRVTAQELWSIAKKQRLICPLSGRKLTIESISIDHIIPISKGGTNHPSNIRFVDYHANLALAHFGDAALIQLAKDIINTCK